MAGKTRGRTSTRAVNRAQSSAAHPQTAADPKASTSMVGKEASGSRPTTDIIADTRRVLASIDPYASPYHPRHRREDHQVVDGVTQEGIDEIVQTSLSLAAFKAEILSRSGESANRESRRRSSSDNRQGTTAVLERGNGGERKGDSAEVDWQMYRDWPEGVMVEEEAMKTYFQRLKFIYLETATKLTFLNDCTQEMIHDHQSLAKLEQDAARAKADLKAGKDTIRKLRTGIDEVSDSMVHPYAELEEQSDEAKALISNIRDMELELAKIRATTGSSKTRFDINSNVAPKMGTMTLEEAEAFNEEQLMQMQILQESTTTAQALTKEKQKELASTMRAVERLNVERKREEKYAEEVKESNRDREVEELCENRVATLNLLKGTLGISTIEAHSDTELRITFLPQASAAAETEPIKLVLQYDVAGGKLQSYCVVKLDDSDADVPEENVPLLEAAFAANDAPQLIQELWRAMAAPAVESR
ncbi:hypothetical protein K437DRAFT_104068 [Tilletiaria anomala UBC 951]|uniref:Kinetochore protein Sos7 coiled-coil domain-containing protein n=1 Tax=Tilletiaria anomala (strain ATCC 24038 / CBS 436.72 / UBC 951) TaxID=1037660 RepID=A0A066W2L0_TILAU|nr:uncharacterized protein K437DRAFT_104068 [Tilletiaria anomala UBC 951]KDN46783.1 hypothetical protein K437DRAFT_104068 [Tilletiaria anomala UBC 951]